jgi:hypothetical protein
MNLTEALARSRNAKQANPQAHGVAGRMPRRTGVLGDHGTPGLGWKDCAGGAFRPDPSRLPTTLEHEPRAEPVRYPANRPQTDLEEHVMTDLIWSFAPWIVFLLANRVTSFYGAIGAALATAAVVLVRAVARRRLHLLDLASLGYFLALGAVLVTIHPGHLDFWARYAQAGSHTALTVIVFASILIGHPFTESYARQTTPKAVWHTAEFHAINRRISAVWGLAFLVGTVSLFIAGSVDYRQVLLRVIIPFGSLAWAYKYTLSQQDRRPVAAQAGA